MTRKHLRAGFFLAFFVLGAVITVFALVQVSAQTQTVDVLHEELRQKGVPIKEIVVINRLPFEIEIVLQSASVSQELALDDLWFMQLARRTATLAHRVGLGVSSYKLTILNAQGETITWEQNYLYPSDLSQQPSTALPPQVDAAATQKLVAERLSLAGLTLDSVNILFDNTLNQTGQIVVIQVSAPNLEAANQALVLFLESLVRGLDALNAEVGTQIVLCRVRLIDAQGQVLLNYVRDLETREETSSSVAGLGKWYPYPPEENPDAVNPTPAPDAYPAQAVPAAVP